MLVHDAPHLRHEALSAELYPACGSVRDNVHLAVVDSHVKDLVLRESGV